MEFEVAEEHTNFRQNKEHNHILTERSCSHSNHFSCVSSTLKSLRRGLTRKIVECNAGLTHTVTLIKSLYSAQRSNVQVIHSLCWKESDRVVYSLNTSSTYSPSCWCA